MIHICTIIPIAQTVGANRIVKAVAIPHPVGNPNLPEAEEHAQRKDILLTALKGLETDVDDQTVL